MNPVSFAGGVLFLSGRHLPLIMPDHRRRMLRELKRTMGPVGIVRAAARRSDEGGDDMGDSERSQEGRKLAGGFDTDRLRSKR